MGTPEAAHGSGGEGRFVLYSFPHPLGGPGIGWTAFQHVVGLHRQGWQVNVVATSLERELPPSMNVHTTMTVAGMRIPHRTIGRSRALEFHDWRSARQLDRLAELPDVVHVWPGATVHTARAARRLGIPVLRECPNTHTAHAVGVAEREASMLGLTLPPGHSHRASPKRLRREEAEYSAADALLVPSEMVANTFRARGFRDGQLLLHRYGFDPETAARSRPARDGRPLTVAFVGSGEPRKGLHLLLDAWFASGAHERARLVIAGRLLRDYEHLLGRRLAHPSIERVGFVDDVGVVLARAHVLALPSLEEGSALVTYEAQGWACALLVSDAAGARCTHGVTGLVHPAGDVATLTAQLRAILDSPDLVERMCGAAWAGRADLTWDAGAQALAEAYLAVNRAVS